MRPPIVARDSDGDPDTPLLSRDPSGAGSPETAVDSADLHYRYSDVTPKGDRFRSSKVSPETSFRADEIQGNIEVSPRRRRLHRRTWYLHHDLDVSPGESKLGPESRWYADEHSVVGDEDKPLRRENLSRTEAVGQYLGLPEPVAARVRTHIAVIDLNSLGGDRGIDHAIVGFSVLALTEYLELRGIDELRKTHWWGRISAIADDLGILGATGRNFRLLLNYIEGEYGSEQYGE